jgi:hypothetical protein
MAKFRYQHINSSIEGKAPSVEQLKDAEIAINTFPGKEKLYIKNSAAEPEVVAFITENQVKTLVDSVSGDITTIIDTISGDVVTISGDVTTISGDVITISGDVITISGDIQTISGDVITISGDVQTISGDVITISGDVIAISGDVITISGDVDTLKATKFGAVNYDSTAKKIYFYANNTGETALAEVDATDFIKDGMVENVEIKDIEESGETITVLAITFNTDAGKEEIDIPLTEIFDPNNYVKVEDYEEDQAVIASALNDLNERKLGKAEFEEEELIIAAALNDLKETKASKVHTHVLDDITDLEVDEFGNIILRAGTF